LAGYIEGSGIDAKLKISLVQFLKDWGFVAKLALGKDVGPRIVQRAETEYETDKFTDEQLLNLYSESKQKNWQASPAYWHAIFTEIDRRELLTGGANIKKDQE
jgi:hypothetical protein